jgi:hypothetical protein
MGIFYSISISEQSYRSKKIIKKIFNQQENISVKSLSKNSLSIFLVDNHNNNHSDVVNIIDKINDNEEKVDVKIITNLKLPELNVINCNKINEYEHLSTLKDCLRDELKLDNNLVYNDISFHEEDIKTVEFLLKALFYNLYDDNLSYDRAFLLAMSYISSKSLKSQSLNKTMISDRLVYCCLKDWYEKYYKYKKTLFNSYKNYYESIRQILENDTYAYLSNVEPLKSYPLNNTYAYYVKEFITEIKNQSYGHKTYKKYLLTELILFYNTPKYQETNYDKLYNLSSQFIDNTKILLSIVDYWVILYNIQKLEKSNTVNNVVIYTNQGFNKNISISLEDMGFSDY